MNVRHAAVAGQFYSDDPNALRAEVQKFVAEAGSAPSDHLKALIAPHAGYMYSGPIAGSAYALLAGRREVIRRVLLLGPSHFVRFSGLALSTADAFESPLGLIPVDESALDEARGMRQVTTLDAAHRQEHSLEVHLPFLQTVLGEFKLIPLVVGDASPEDVAEVISRLWGGLETCVVISSDLSHFHDYLTAKRLDQATAESIQALDWGRLNVDQACGCRPVRGLLRCAQDRGMKCVTLDLRNSGDTAGRQDRVVGYGSFAFYEK